MSEFKKELIKLVKSHKKDCDGNCNISLIQVRLKAEKIGMVFSEEEKSLFHQEVSMDMIIRYAAIFIVGFFVGLVFSFVLCTAKIGRLNRELQDYDEICEMNEEER